jgi:phosphohistidine phosphatase
MHRRSVWVSHVQAPTIRTEGRLYYDHVKLYLVQHGQAEAEDADPKRPLTEQGVEDVGRVADYALERLGVRPAQVLHSGKLRARQTAEIWGRRLNVEVEQADALAPNDDPKGWVEQLDTETDDLMLVGHLPHLARLAGLLLTGDADRAVIRFAQGGLVGLERTDAGWVTSVVLPPRSQ